MSDDGNETNKKNSARDGWEYTWQVNKCPPPRKRRKGEWESEARPFPPTGGYHIVLEVHQDSETGEQGVHKLQVQGGNCMRKRLAELQPGGTHFGDLQREGAYL